MFKNGRARVVIDIRAAAARIVVADVCNEGNDVSLLVSGKVPLTGAELKDSYIIERQAAWHDGTSMPSIPCRQLIGILFPLRTRDVKLWELLSVGNPALK